MTVIIIGSGHSLILECSESSFYFCLGSWCLWCTIIDCCTNSCRQQLHLMRFIVYTIIKGKYFELSVFCNGWFDDFHQINKVIVIKNIDSYNKSWSIIKQCNNIHSSFGSVFFYIVGDRWIPTPYFVDMFSFISFYFLCLSNTCFFTGFIYKTSDGANDRSSSFMVLFSISFCFISVAGSGGFFFYIDDLICNSIIYSSEFSVISSVFYF